MDIRDYLEGFDPNERARIIISHDYINNPDVADIVRRTANPGGGEHQQTLAMLIIADAK